MTWTPQTLRFVSRRLNDPVDVASLAAFRVLFGALMAFAMIRFLANGWVEEFYVKPTYFFTYELLPWIKPFPAVAMHVLFVALAALALCVAAGFCYRLSVALFFLGFTYAELIDKTTYLNHYYLVSLLSGLMIFIPAHRAWSIDAWLRPKLGAELVPGWTLWVLHFQIAVVYIFAGLAKLNADWLFDAQPMRIWLAARSDLPLVGSFLDDAWNAYTASWAGAAYDLTIVFFLCHRRTRPWAFVAVIVFHLVTCVLFRIGMFPWLMIASSTLFFAPDWPRRWLGASVTGCLPRHPYEASSGVHGSLHPVAIVALIAYVGVQLFLPLRQYLQSESSAWTFRGFNWSWRVMLVEKTGHSEFRAIDPETGQNLRILATDYLTPRQAQFMAQDPAMIRTLAQHIASDLRARGWARVQIYADSYASLNGRPSQRLVDPSVDFAAPLPSVWITELRRDASESHTMEGRRLADFRLGR